jgi:hypothetical protein
LIAFVYVFVVFFVVVDLILTEWKLLLGGFGSAPSFKTTLNDIPTVSLDDNQVYEEIERFNSVLAPRESISEFNNPKVF